MPVITGPTQASWPLDENYCRTCLILHWPNWRTLSDIKGENSSWIQKFTYFLDQDICPNFIKADVQRAKSKHCYSPESAEDMPVPNDDIAQPGWMDVIRPIPNFKYIPDDFNFNDGGPDHDWSKMSNMYPDNFSEEWWETK